MLVKLSTALQESSLPQTFFLDSSKYVIFCSTNVETLNTFRLYADDIEYKFSHPRWSSPCRGEGAYPPRSSKQSASTRRAQLSVAAKVVRPTDPLNHNVKT